MSTSLRGHTRLSKGARPLASPTDRELPPRALIAEVQATAFPPELHWAGRQAPERREDAEIRGDPGRRAWVLSLDPSSTQEGLRSGRWSVAAWEGLEQPPCRFCLSLGATPGAKGHRLSAMAQPAADLSWDTPLPRTKRSPAGERVQAAFHPGRPFLEPVRLLTERPLTAQTRREPPPPGGTHLPAGVQREAYPRPGERAPGLSRGRGREDS